MFSPVWCHCTSCKCGSSGMLRLLGSQWRPWTLHQDLSSWCCPLICPSVATVWSLLFLKNQWCWHTIFPWGCWMLPMWVWYGPSILQMLSAGPLSASQTLVVGRWALPLHPLDVLWDFLFLDPVCLDLQHVLKWFLFPHLWHFLPHAGHSLCGWDVPHLLHVLPWLPLDLWPWPFLCLKVLMSSMVVAIATPLLDLCQLKSLMVASCCLACSSSLLNVTVVLCCLWSDPLLYLKVFCCMEE